MNHNLLRFIHRKADRLSGSAKDMIYFTISRLLGFVRLVRFIHCGRGELGAAMVNVPCYRQPNTDQHQEDQADGEGAKHLVAHGSCRP